MHNLQPATIGEKTWGACGLFDDKLKIIRNFDRIRFAGSGFVGDTAYLNCGPRDGSGFGYWHIYKGHVYNKPGEWGTIASLIGVNWRDLVDYTLAKTFRHPQKINWRPRFQNWCWSRHFVLADKDGNVVKDYNPRRTWERPADE